MGKGCHLLKGTGVEASDGEGSLKVVGRHSVGIERREARLGAMEGLLPRQSNYAGCRSTLEVSEAMQRQANPGPSGRRSRLFWQQSSE